MPRHYRMKQLAVVISAVLAALAGYGIIHLLDIELVLDNGNTVAVPEVITMAVAGGLLACLVYEVLARMGQQRWWPFVGSTALAISMLGPTYQADGEAAVALICLHFIVAIVMIWGLAMAGARNCEPAHSATQHAPNVR